MCNLHVYIHVCDNYNYSDKAHVLIYCVYTFLMHIYLPTYTYICMCVHTCIHIHTCMHTYIHSSTVCIYVKSRYVYVAFVLMFTLFIVLKRVDCHVNMVASFS